ncbi:MAG: SBBP repeat-containing protein [Flavobacteriales bacterium]|nr:SBBP repeat-containing protein [Flavobacteriales bacterium]
MNKTNLFLSLLLIVAFSFNSTAQENKVNTDAQEALSNLDKQFFIENKGQWAADVLYLTRIGGLDAWITKKGINYTFYKLEEINQEQSSNRELEMPDKFEQKDYNIIGHRVLMNLIGSNLEVIPEGKDKQTAYYNYFIGNDDNKHASNVGLYKEALVKDVYIGIDMRYYFDKGNLRYDYIVNPGADPKQIRFSIDGSENTYVNTQGELIFTTRFGEVKNADLYCYQKQDKKTVNAKFTNLGEYLTITLGDYNKNQTLIIDPLIYSTYIGGSNTEWGNSIVLNATNNAYITGQSESIDYDIIAGAFQTTNAGIEDVFVTKLNATGTTLLYSTYIGGSGSERGQSIAIDVSGNAYVTGYTGSTNFDITAGAFQTINDGMKDIFVTKLNATGTAILYSTYLGGNNDDFANSIAIDTSGNAYITGYTGYFYDVTSGAYQTTFLGGNWDAFVTKLNSTGTALVYSTFIGGSDTDWGFSIALDASNNAYIFGETRSTNYNTTSGAFQTTFGGGLNDVFVTKLNASGTALLYSTYIGGNDYDYGYSLALDASGNAYVTGYTSSSDYDVTLGAFQTTYGGGLYDVFVTKLNATGTDLLYSTYIGGSSSDLGRSIALDASGNAYITGYTSSTNFDITLGAFQTTFAGAYDVFVTRLNATGTALLYSTYIGGSSDDRGFQVVLDDSAYAYITGYTKSTNYDITAGVFQTTYGGSTDIFVSKLDMYGSTNIIEIPTTSLFSVFPNPSHGVYQIVLQNTNSTVDVLMEVYNLQGKLILNKDLSKTKSTSLNLSNKPNGIYILKISDTQSTQVIKLVKE